jgi:prepilin-type N-terminal cleavage/methylation domain-containing protein
MNGRRQADDGFTLVELVITVAIMGIVMAALVGIVLSYLRNTVDTASRLTASHDVQFAAAYWQRDVASIGVRSSTYDTAPAVHSFPLEQSVGLSPCSLPAGATAVVTLGWSDYGSLTSTDAPTVVKVTYASRAAGSAFELIRVRCGSEPSTVRVANSLATVPTVACRRVSGTATSCTGAGTDVPARVDMSLQVQQRNGQDTTAYTATLSGERRQT